MKILKILKSRTVLTIIVLFLINGITGIVEFVPPQLLPIVNLLLGLAAIYFRVKPKVNFSE